MTKLNEAELRELDSKTVLGYTRDTIVEITLSVVRNQD